MSFSLSTRGSALSDNMKGSLLMVAAMAAFAVNDALVKYATAEIASAQVMAVRGAMASVLLFGIAASRGLLRPAREAFRGAVLARTLADVAGTITYITALAHLPLANASAIFQALPLTVTLGAVLFFGERPGWRRWLAIAVGFVGVLIIVRPGTEGFTVFSLLVLASVVFCALRDLTTRKVPAGTPSIFVSGVTAIAVMLFGTVMMGFSDWQPMRADILLALALASIAIAIGYVAIVATMRVGEVGFVAPFRYTILIFAIILGILFFSEVPAVYDLVGSTIVVASGIYMIYRERQLGRARMARAQVH